MSPSSRRTTEAGAIRVRLYRFNAETDSGPRYDSFEVPRRARMRVLDVLDYIHETLAEDIGYRWLCTSKKCGTCAVNVNGSPVLACWEEAQPDMTIEPLGNLPVIRDLVTAREPFQDFLARLSPQLVRKREYPGFPESFSEADFAPGVHLRDCIQCLACHSVCPVVAQPDSGFAGPALLVALSELALDPRDEEDRAALADREAQVFKCVSCYECERVCPVEIPIVGAAIEPLKRLAFLRSGEAGARRARAFLAVVKERGYANGAVVALRTKGIDLGALRLAARMVRRGKIDLMETFLRRRSSRAGEVRRTYESGEEIK